MILFLLAALQVNADDPTLTPPSQWSLVSSTPSGNSTFIRTADKGSIATNGRYWEHVINGATHTLIHREIDCQKRTIRALFISVEDRVTGTAESADLTTRNEIKPIAPGTTGDDARRFVCST